ncbi:MAG: GNAT family N-acetyltransferase [Bacteroidetes bacterium]|nr:GNAT family N-acetyltransferase [Bacteroidota bacterium]
METLSDTELIRHRTAEEHSLRIRPLEPADRSQILTLLRGTEVFTDDEIAIARELIDCVFEKEGQEDYIIHSYDDGGTVLGYYCLGPTPATEGTYDLYWIAVHPSMHGTGIGAALDAHAEELVRSRGGRLIVAETSSQLKYGKTRSFYLRRGYAELSRIRDYYKPGDDLVVFGKYLRP